MSTTAQRHQMPARRVHLILVLYTVALILFIYGFILLTFDVDIARSTRVAVSRRDVSISYQLENATVESEESIVTATDLESISDPCARVHIAIPVRRTTDILVLLKSILLYRHRSPLHIHFIVSGQFTASVTSKLMRSWRLPQVLSNVYDISKAPETSLLWNKLTSTAEFAGFVKLLLPSILPVEIEKVIFMDSNLIITGDIKELWKRFGDLGKSTERLIGAKSVDDVCGAADTSVILFDLKGLRNSTWSRNWRLQMVDAKPTDKQVASSLFCKIAHQFTFFNIPCSWNVDLSNETATRECSLNYGEYNAFHWKSHNISQSLAYLTYFNKLKEFIIQYDGSLLSYIPMNCENSFSISPSNDEDQLIKALKKGQDKLMCEFLKKQSKQVFRTFTYYYGKPYHPRDDHETTMVTQLSLDRLRTFSTLIYQWDGPISISMYGTDFDAWKFSQFISTFSVLIKRNNVAVHVVYKQGQFYPVNYLRNIALQAVKTPYVFLNDGDFMPVKTLFSYLKEMNQMLLKDAKVKTALVIPAFETSKFKLKFPTSKEQLLQQIRLKTVTQFCVSCAHKTHAPTNYRTWYKARQPYRIEWASHFEPYVVVRSNVVKYDERFMGYGYNKVSQITELKAQGYKFIVVPNGFIIHMPHPPSIDKKIWEHKSFKACINSVWEEFNAELLKKYGKNCLKEEKAPPKFIR